MTLDAPLPTDLRQWVTLHLLGLDTVVDASWPRDCSRVWRVASGTDEVYVKLGFTEKDYAREVRACKHAGRFAPHEVPRLLATDPDLRAIMISPVPGLVVRGLLTVEVETRVHELAGRLLEVTQVIHEARAASAVVLTYDPDTAWWCRWLAEVTAEREVLEAIFEGTPADLVAACSTLTGEHLAAYVST